MDKITRPCTSPTDVACIMPGVARELEGVFVAPSSGYYSFWVQGAGNVKLFVDSNLTNAVAESPSLTMRYDEFPLQRSEPILVDTGAPLKFVVRQDAPHEPGERASRFHLQVASRAFNPANVALYDPTVAVIGQYHAVPQQVLVSTVVPDDEFSLGVDEILISGVTAETSLTFKVTDPLSGRKGTGGKKDAPGCPETDTCSKQWADLGGDNAAADMTSIYSGGIWMDTNKDLYSCWKCYKQQPGFYLENPSGRMSKVFITTNFTEEAPDGSGRIGWAKIRMEWRAMGLTAPPKMQVHEVGCTEAHGPVADWPLYGYHTADDDTVTPLYGCTSDGQAPDVTYTTPEVGRYRSGSFRIKVNGLFSTWLSHKSAERSNVQEAIRAIPGCDKATVFDHAGVPDKGKTWKVQFDQTYGQNYVVEVDTIDPDSGNVALTPSDLPPTVAEIQANGGNDWLLDPAPLFMFSPTSSVPMAQVEVNGIRSICNDENDGENCKFTYDASLTPVVESLLCIESSSSTCSSSSSNSGAEEPVQIRAGDRFSITGTGFVAAAVDGEDDGADGVVLLEVFFGTAACNVVASTLTATSADCIVSDSTVSASVALKVTSSAFGDATVSPTAVDGNLASRTFAYSGSVDSVVEKGSDTGSSGEQVTASVTGGNVLVITGTGFALLDDTANDNQVTVGDNACNVVSASFTTLECILPSAPGIDAGTAFNEVLSNLVSNVVVGIISSDSVATVAWSWAQTMHIAAMEPTVLSAGITTKITMEGVFSSSAGIAETLDCKHSFHVETTTTSRQCKSLVLNATHASCTLPRGPAPPIGEQQSARPVLRLCTSAGFATHAFYTGVIDYALRLDSITPNLGSLAGGTVLTVVGAGFADEEETMVVTGFARQKKVASNDAGILTPHRRIPCAIVSASFNTIKCITARFSAGSLTSGPADHGHSGGGINGRFELLVNELAAAGVPDQDPNGMHSDQFHAANETAGIIAEGSHLTDSSLSRTLVELSLAARLLQIGNAAQWIDFYRSATNAEICLNEKLMNAAQKYAEELSETYGSAQSNIFQTASPPHVGIDGSTAQTRVEEQGYSFTVLGEAIAFVPSQSGAAAVRAWQIDGVDRSYEIDATGTSQRPFDINDPKFGEFGIGLADGYFVAVFAAPVGDACESESASFGSRRRRMIATPDAISGDRNKNGNGNGTATRTDPTSLHAMAVEARSSATFDFDAAELAEAASSGNAVGALILGLDLELMLVDVTRRTVDVETASSFPPSFARHRWYTGSVVGWDNARVSLGVRANGEVHGSIQLPKSELVGPNNAIVIEVNSDDGGAGAAHASLTYGPPESISMADSHGHALDIHETGQDEVGADATSDVGGTGNATLARERRTVGQNTCQIFIDADKYFYKQWGGSGNTEQRVERTILAMLDAMIAAQEVFYHNFAADGGPYLHVVGASVHTDYGFGEADPAQQQDPNAVLSEYSNFLAADNAAASSSGRHRASSDPRGDDVCLNHLFTHANFGEVVGLANLGTACKSDFSNTAFTSTRSANGRMSLAGRQATAIHEIGHNFNAPHDCSDESAVMCASFLAEAVTPDIEDECIDTGDNYLMWPSVTYGANAAVFSPCSRGLILATTSQLTCLVADPIAMEWYQGIPTLAPLRDPNATTAPPTTTQAWLYHEYEDDASHFVGEFDFVEASTPHLEAIAPLSAHGAARITVSGSGLLNTEWVQVGGLNCTSLVVESDDTIACDVPTIAAGKYHVRVMTTSGFAAHPLLHEDEVTFVSLLALTDISPSLGSRAGGTTVTLIGHGFGNAIDGCAVRVGESSAVVLSVSPSAITIITPDLIPATPIATTDETAYLASVQISIQTNDDGPDDYGQLLETQHISGRVALPPNCQTCSYDSFEKQVSGRVNAVNKKEIWSPSWFTIMSSNCNALLSADSTDTCYFGYSDLHTPQVLSISPSTGAASTSVVIVGAHLLPLPSLSESTVVVIGGAPCTVDVAASSDTSVACEVGDAIAGVHAPYVTVPGKGVAALGASNEWQFAATGSVSSIAFDGTDGGSVGGGDVVTLVGNGFGQTAVETSVNFCDSPCTVTASSYNQVTCTTSSINTPLSLFRFGNEEHTSLRRADDPQLSSFNDPGAANENAPFDRSYQTSYTSSQHGECWAGLDSGPGRLMLLSKIRFFPVGYIQVPGEVYATPGGAAMKGGWFEASNATDGPWTVLAEVIDPHQGWNWVDVDVGVPAQYVRYRGSSTSDCDLTHLDFIGVVAQSNTACPATVVTQAATDHPSRGPDATAPTGSFESAAGVTFFYNEQATPIITSIAGPGSSWYGSSLGGTTVTIVGERLPGDALNANVVVNGRPCTDVTVSQDRSTIKCITSRRAGFVPPSVSVTYNNADQSNGWTGTSVHSAGMKLFRYLDRWSESNTWLNDEPPGEGDSVLVPLDQTLIMDVSPPKHLRVVLVQGVFVFDDIDVELNVEYMLVQGGKLEVGTEDHPFTHQANITLHGTEEESIGLPTIGSKVLAVMGAPGAGSSIEGGGASASRRDIGEIDLHGTVRVTTWANVDATVEIGDTAIAVSGSVDFQNGDRIIVTGPPEEFVVVSVSTDGLVVTVDNPAVQRHVSEIRDVSGGETFDLRCEVGVLTRNVVVQGANGQSSKEFGGHVVATESSEFRSSYAEYRNCGQAGRSRHCIHLHHLGAIHDGESYLRGNSIHRSFNRGIVLSSTSGIMIHDNVAYKVEGHNFHQEDADSIMNEFVGNIGVLTTKTLACGRSDCKPATFAIASPRNYWRKNVAADSMKNGFGWAMKPMSPESYHAVLEFHANTAHHCAVGLFIKVPYMPSEQVTMSNNSFFKNRQLGVFHKATGDVHHVHSTFGLNGGADFLWMGYIYGAPETRFAAQIRDSVFLGAFGTGVGLYGPKGEYFFVSGLSFDDYGPNAPAIKGCAACCCIHGVKQGAYTYRYERLSFSDTTPVRVGWACPFKQIHFDLDGSLTGHVNGSVTAYKEFNDWSDDCTVSDVEFSNGIVCNGAVRIRRLAISGVDPQQIDGQPLWLKKSKQEVNAGGEMEEIYGGPDWESFGTTRTLFAGECRSTVSHGYLRDTETSKYCWTRAGYGSGCAFPDTSSRWREDSVYGEPGHYGSTLSSVMVCKWDSLGQVNNNHPVGSNSLFRFQELPGGEVRIFQEVGPSTGLKALSQGGCGARREVDLEDVGYWYPEWRENWAGFGTVVYRTCPAPMYNTRGRQQLTACDATGAANEVFKIEILEEGLTERDPNIIIIQSTIDGTYLGGPDNIFGRWATISSCTSLCFPFATLFRFLSCSVFLLFSISIYSFFWEVAFA